MTDQELPDLLDRLASRHPVGAPPTDAMLGAASRRHRRRATWAAVATVGAVAAVMIAGVVLPRLPDGRTPPPAVPLTSAPSATDVVVPAGMRLVAVGRVGILVPDTFATNAIGCGTPIRDGVIVDIGVIESCGLIGAKVYDSVWIHEGGYQNIFKADRDIEISGVEARRQDAACETYPIDNMHPHGETRTSCSGTVYFPAVDVYFAARSATAAGVDSMLDGVVVLGPDQVGVPGTAEALYSVEHVRDQADSGEFYAHELEALGLQVRVVHQLVRGIPAGLLRRVDPQPGTVLSTGDTVTVVVTAAAITPSDAVSVSVNSVGPGDSMDYRNRWDAEIRAGTTIRLAVGSRIWGIAQGKGSATLAGTLEGTSLQVDNWEDGPNYPHAWLAVAPGTTIITLTITADGQPVTLGTVTVIVE